MGSIKLCLIIIIIFSFADLLAVPEFIFRQNVALASSGAERAGGLFENIRVVPQTFTDGFIDGLEVMREKANIAQASLAYFFSGFGESINNFTSIFSGLAYIYARGADGIFVISHVRAVHKPKQSYCSFMIKYLISFF